MINRAHMTKIKFKNIFRVKGFIYLFLVFLGVNLWNPCTQLWAETIPKKNNVAEKEIEKLLNKDPRTILDDEVKIILQEIDSEDLNKRLHAFDTLAKVAMANTYLKQVEKHVNVDLNQYSHLYEVLIPLLSTPLGVQRELALLTLNYGFKHNQEVVDILVARWKIEPSYKVKLNIVEYLEWGRHTSPQIDEIYFEALENPKLEYRTIFTLGVVTPENGLPRLIKKLEATQSQSIFQMILQAIESYKEKAKPYLSELEKLLFKIEQDQNPKSYEGDKNIVVTALKLTIEKLKK